MTIEELIVYGKKHIHKDQTILLLSSLLGVNYFDIYKDLNQKVDEKVVEKYKRLIEGIKNNTPIQYLLGKTNFYGYEFIVNEHVLIPRFETEYLVEKTIKIINNKFSDNIRIADIGTGSGVIAITLKKKMPKAIVDAVDISKEALQIAQKNAEIQRANINFIEGNILDKLNEKYDVLISNPPYIPKNEKVDISTTKEPDLALYAKDDGYYFYQEIISNSDRILKDTALIAFEIGYNQQERIIKIIKDKYPQSEVICEKDLNNLDRYIFAMIKK